MARKGLIAGISGILVIIVAAVVIIQLAKIGTFSRIISAVTLPEDER